MRVNCVLVIGGGPAGLRAAEVANAAGSRVTVCDGQRSVGRKFLVAGRGGLNLTHGEPVENFPARFVDEPQRWRDLLEDFGPDDLRAWATELGVETYVGTSGRVFPRGQKAAGLLRAWLRRLRASGVQFRTGARFVGLAREANKWRAEFRSQGAAVSKPPMQKNEAIWKSPFLVKGATGNFTVDADTIVLALGGASWPETGSDGAWSAVLAAHGIEITPWQPANCGWEVDWPPALLSRAEGLPLKNLTVRAGEESVSGELLITAHGLEGGAIYRLGRTLRGMSEPSVAIDFKPQLTVEVLRERIANQPDAREWLRAWKLSAGAVALLETISPSEDREELLGRVKNFVLPLRGPRPILEAISSAGGVPWAELDENLRLRKLPGVFVAGEMIDWEAPTGGYLLQGCFATGTRAGHGAASLPSG
jgi:uncharacterized flavoprotein (TIGR03862 family)